MASPKASRPVPASKKKVNEAAAAATRVGCAFQKRGMFQRHQAANGTNMKAPAPETLNVAHKDLENPAHTKPGRALKVVHDMASVGEVSPRWPMVANHST